LIEEKAGTDTQYSFTACTSSTCTCTISSMHRILFYPEDGDSIPLQNIGKYLPDYTVSHPRRQVSSYTRTGNCIHCSSNFCTVLQPLNTSAWWQLKYIFKFYTEIYKIRNKIFYQNSP
jgi:hypothetical protein